MKLNRSFQTVALEQQTNFFKLLSPLQETNLLPWLLINLVLVSSLATSLFFTHKKKALELAFLQNKTKELAEINEDLKDKMHAFHSLKDSHKDLKNKVCQLRKLHHPNTSQTAQLLRTLHVGIRQKTWIQQVKMTSPHTTHVVGKSTTVDKFEIMGKTFDPDQIRPLINDLSWRLSSISYMKLSSLHVGPERAVEKGVSTKVSTTSFTLTGLMQRSSHN